MKFNSLLGLASALLAQSVAGQDTSDDPEAVLGPISPVSVDTGRYIVKFSGAGSAKFRKRDGSPVC